MPQNGWYYCPNCHKKVEAQDDTSGVSLKTVRPGVESPRRSFCADCLARPASPADMQAQIDELRATVARQARGRTAVPVS